MNSSIRTTSCGSGNRPCSFAIGSSAGMGFAGVALGCTGGRAARSGRRGRAGARRAARARTPRALRGLRGTRAHRASRHARGARAGARMAHRRRARGPAVRARIKPRRAGTRRASVDVGHHRQCRLRACKRCEHAASGQRPRSPVAPPHPLSRDEARALFTLLQAAPARIDMQVDTGHGGFALAEWAGQADRVLLKTASGPLLVADPWAEDAS